MNATIRGLKGMLALGALACLGLVLRWVTAGSIDAASTQDLTSMASLTVGAVAWVAYSWLVVAALATVLEQVPGAIGRSASLVTARITSQGSRALLRSALGVAAVTPLTIGVAQATPADAPNPFTTPEPSSTIQLSSIPGARPWSAVEPPSTIHLPGSRTTQNRPPANTTGAPTHSSQSSSAGAGSADSRSVEPRSAVEITGDSPTDWRAPEKPSSIQLTGPDSSKPPATPERTEAERPTNPRTQPTGRRTAVPAKSPAGQITVPDRPTTGAPTRYTHLKSGQLARSASRVVKPGDSLWSIAAAELGPNATAEAIATRWPQWYAANRHLIGPDPNLIHPGQVLTSPAPTHPVPPTHQEK